MGTADELVSQFDGLDRLSPAGFAVGLHLDFTTSKYIFQSYSRTWMEEYSRRGYLLSDPTVRWGLENSGWIRWSDLQGVDPAGVIEAAKAFGLTYGLTVSVVQGDTRSIGSFASSEAEFGADAIALFQERLTAMHRLAAGITPDSVEDKRVKRFAASLSGIDFHDL